MPDTPKQSYSEREGRGPKAGPVPFERIRRMVVSVFDGLREAGYFQEGFGIECVDGDKAGIVGSDVADYFFRRTHRDGIWPYWPRPWLGDYYENAPSDGWDADTLFDVIEVIYEHVSAPIEDRRARYHDFANCGWHYGTFTKAEGQARFRSEINDVLRLADPPLVIGADGLISELAPDEFRPMMAAPLPATAAADDVGRVEAAKRAFLARGATNDDRRHAVRDLADVLEHLRPQVKQAMLSKDENELFNLANGFGIRHHNRSQRGDYDQVVWLRWAFYVYLATIHAVTRVIDGQTSP
jgi:hypothetical protein